MFWPFYTPVEEYGAVESRSKVIIMLQPPFTLVLSYFKSSTVVLDSPDNQ